MFKLIVGGLIAVVVVALGASTLSSQRQQRELDEIERAKDRGTLQWYVKKAKIKGENEAVLPAGVRYYSVPEDLETALAYYDVVVAELIESKSNSIHPMEIETWHKFRVIDYLSHKDITDCPTCPSPRAPLPDMLPLNEDEILVPKGGGVVELDGVKLRCVDPEFPEFEKSKRYLLFLDLNKSTKVGALKMGSSGAYFLIGGDVMKLVNSERKYEINDKIAAKFGDSAALLRDYLKSREAKKSK